MSSYGFGALFLCMSMTVSDISFCCVLRAKCCFSSLSIPSITDFKPALDRISYIPSPFREVMKIKQFNQKTSINILKIKFL